MNIKQVGVIGVTGTMGRGIAQVCAQYGFNVIGTSVDTAALPGVVSSISAAYDKLVERGKMTSEVKDAAVSRLRITTSYADFKDCDLVIEAVTERLDIKRPIFAEMDKICGKHAILASNTSALPIAQLAAATNRPDKVVGLHFFNPAPTMKLIEIIRAKDVSEETLQACRDFATALEKTAVTVVDVPGFIVNRLAVVFMMDAMRLLEDEVSTAADIDTAVNLGLNHPMGPLALADLIGNDVVLSIADSIYQALKEEKYHAPKILRDMVSAGKLGRKTGKGFYDYQK